MNTNNNIDSVIKVLDGYIDKNLNRPIEYWTDEFKNNLIMLNQLRQTKALERIANRLEGAMLS